MFFSLNARALGIDLTASQTIQLAARHGFGGVDLMVRDLVDRGESPRLLRRQLADHGLRPGAWPLPVDWRSADAAQLASDLDRLPRYADAAVELGLTRTGTWVLPAWPIDRWPGWSPEATLAAADAFHREALAPIVRILARAGVQLGLEVIGVEHARAGLGLPYLWRHADPRLSALAAELNALVETSAGQAPTVGLLLDAFHLHAAGESVQDLTGWPVATIAWAHVADLPPDFAGAARDLRDADRGLPGAGRGAVDLAGVLGYLAHIGYDGPITPEPLAGCRALAGRAPEARVALVAAALRSLGPILPRPGE